MAHYLNKISLFTRHISCIRKEKCCTTVELLLLLLVLLLKGLRLRGPRCNKCSTTPINPLDQVKSGCRDHFFNVWSCYPTCQACKVSKPYYFFVKEQFQTTPPLILIKIPFKYVLPMSI